MRRLAVAVLAAALVFGAVAVAVGLSGTRALAGTVLEVGEDVTAATLDNGEPVFVVPQPDGSVSVLSAINPHLDYQAVYCPRSQTFYELGPSSRFDRYGHWLAGPAPRGLDRYDARVIGDGLVQVGERGEGPGREVPAYPPAGPDCDVDVDERDGFREWMPDAVAHDFDELYGLARRPEDVALASGFTRVAARIHADESEVRLCAPSAQAGCPADAPPVVSTFHDRRLDGYRGWMDAELLARRVAGGFVDVAVVWEYWEQGDMDFVHNIVQSTARGTLVAVEHEGADWWVVLAEPAQPLDWEHEQTPIGEPQRRWPLADNALLAVPPDPVEVVPGQRGPKDHFRAAEVRDLVTERGTIPVELVIADGVVVTMHGEWDR